MLLLPHLSEGFFLFLLVFFFDWVKKPNFISFSHHLPWSFFAFSLISFTIHFVISISIILCSIVLVLPSLGLLAPLYSQGISIACLKPSYARSDTKTHYLAKITTSTISTPLSHCARPYVSILNCWIAVPCLLEKVESTLQKDLLRYPLQTHSTCI